MLSVVCTVALASLASFGAVVEAGDPSLAPSRSLPQQIPRIEYGVTVCTLQLTESVDSGLKGSGSEVSPRIFRIKSEAQDEVEAKPARPRATVNE